MVAVLRDVLASGFQHVPAGVLDLPTRRSQCDAAQQAALELFPDYSPLKALIHYDIVLTRARRELRGREKRKRLAAANRRKVVAAPWDPQAEPVSLHGPLARPMQVTIGEASEFVDIFAFLRSNIPVQDVLGKDTDVMCSGEEPLRGSNKLPFVEFKRGAVFTDGRLDLCKMVVGPDHISQLMDSLDENRCVRHFLLGNNVITDHGARRIARFIREHPDRMETWYLAGNHIKPDGFKELAEALRGSPVLTNLWMKRNPLGVTSVPALVSLLCDCPHLRTLDLETTEMGNDGVEALFRGIHGKRTALETIYLNSNGVALEGARAISRYVGSAECRLTGLFLSSNPLGCDGAVALAEGLAENKTLEHLTLMSTGISGRGIDAVCRALSTHPRLTSFSIEKAITTTDMGQPFNFVDDTAVDALIAMLRCASLRVLVVGRTVISEENWTRLTEAVSVSDLLVFNGKSIHVTSCDKAMHERLAANYEAYAQYDSDHKRGSAVREDYDTFKNPNGGSRFLRNSRDVRLIDSVYRTRDKRAKGKRLEGKFWDPSDPLWLRLDGMT